jgi:hypothetical protein
LECGGKRSATPFLDSQMPQNVKKSKAPPLSAHSKFRGFAIDEEFFSTPLGFGEIS